MIDAHLQETINAQPYPHLFVTISGAHLYGFPSPDSDYDLRGVHILPIREVIGLDAGRETIELSAGHDGLEIDLVTHEVKKFLQLLLKKNGYVLEQLYSPLVLLTKSSTICWCSCDVDGPDLMRFAVSFTRDKSRPLL